MAWLQRLRNTFRAERTRRDIERELAFHLAERADELRGEGWSDEEAARLARRRFGNLLAHAERTRDMDVSVTVDGLLRDLRYTIRSLVRGPGFSLTVVLTLALGIGANAAVFAAVDAVLLRPLPFPEADRLMLLRQSQATTAETSIAPLRLEDWNRLNVVFESITGYYMEDVSETSGDLPEKVRRAFVAPRFVDVWGMAPALGRGFAAADHQVNSASGVLISDRYWRRRFAAAPHVIGASVRIGSASYPVIGVMPASFLFPDREVDLWFASPLDAPYARSRLSTWYTGVGRLKPGVSLDQARANLAAVQAQLGEQYPDSDAKLVVDIAPLKDRTIGGVRASLWLVFAAVNLLLVITCANVAALLLSRGTQRRHEIALRLSLGASRGAVATQMLMEALVLALAGGGLGIGIAAAGVAALRSGAVALPRVEEIALDWRLLLYTLAITLGVAVVCGLFPAMRLARRGTAGALNEGGRAHLSPRQSLQWTLVGAQVALSVTLLAGAGLLVRSVQALSRVDPGFTPEGVLTFRISGHFGETADYPALSARIDRAIDALRELPDVLGAATSMTLPGVPTQFELAFRLVEAADSQPPLVAENRLVSPEYFATLQISLIEGEWCRRPLARPMREVLVNRTFVRRYLAGRATPLGLHLVGTNAGATPRRIIGVVADVRERGLDRDPAPTVYSCFSAPNPTPAFLVRARGDAAALAPTVRLTIKELEPLRSVYEIAPLEDRIGAAFAQNRLRTWLLASFALTALSLAAVGLYGTISYTVGLRRREIGLRLALGARRGEIVRHFVVHGLRIVGVAMIVGLTLSAGTESLLSGMLYGVAASDLATRAGVVVTVLAVTTVAVLIPATRAALLPPMQVLREE